MHHLHPTSQKRRMHLSAVMMTSTGTRTITTITVIHVLIGHTLIPQPQNPILTHIQTLIHTHILTRKIPIPILIPIQIRTPLLLQSNPLLRDIFIEPPPTITPIRNLLHALTLVLPTTPTRMGITRIHTPMHIYTRQRQTG